MRGRAGDATVIFSSPAFCPYSTPWEFPFATWAGRRCVTAIRTGYDLARSLEGNALDILSEINYCTYVGACRGRGGGLRSGALSPGGRDARAQADGGAVRLREAAAAGDGPPLRLPGNPGGVSPAGLPLGLLYGVLYKP